MTPSRIASLAFAVHVAAWAPRALAWPGYFASDCSGCHDSAVKTCHGCHSHGAQQSQPKTAIGLAGQLDKATYAPGEPVTVMVTGGYEPGMFEAAWQRIVLFDEGMNEVRRSTNDYPVTLSAPAPAAPGSYTWAIAWYGNAARDIAVGNSFGSGPWPTLRPGYFTEDQDNADHGWQTVALPSFTVSASGAGAPDAGTPDAGTPDAGTPDASGGGSSTPDAGTSDAGTDGGTSPSTTPSGGCGTGSGGLAAVVFLTLLAARRLRRRLDV